MTENKGNFTVKDVGPGAVMIEADNNSPEAVASAVEHLLSSDKPMHRMAGRLVATDVSGIIHKWVAEEIDRVQRAGKGLGPDVSGSIISCLLGVMAATIGNDIAYFAKLGQEEALIDKVLRMMKQSAMTIVLEHRKEGQERVKDRLAELKDQLPPKLFREVESEAIAEGLLASDPSAPKPTGKRELHDKWQDLLSNLGRVKCPDNFKGRSLLDVFAFLVDAHRQWQSFQDYVTAKVKTIQEEMNRK